MLIRFSPSGDAATLARLVAEVSRHDAVGLTIVLACDGNDYTPQAIDPVLRAAGKPLIGGIFPQVIHGKRIHDFGVIVVGLECRAATVTVKSPIDAGELQTLLQTSPPQPGHPWRSLISIVDACGPRPCDLIEPVATRLGMHLACLGMGAGSFTLVRKPCALTNDGLLASAAVMALTDISAGIGVAHGWEPISRAFDVTGCEDGAILSVDGRPAFDVYRDVLQARGSYDFERTAFSELAAQHPLEIICPGGERLLLDPVAVDAGGIICMGAIVPAGQVRIMHGRGQRLIAASRTARQAAEAAHPSPLRPLSGLLLQSVSRALCLQHDLHAELAALDPGGVLVGAVSLAEIAPGARLGMCLHTKSAVVGLLDA